MHELKAFVLRLLAAAFVVAICLTVSRAADTQSQHDPVIMSLHLSSFEVSLQR